MNLNALLLLASLLKSTTYGYGELMCGDIGHPVKCDKNAITASGIKLDPNTPQVAIAAPAAMRLAGRYIGLYVSGGKCTRVRLVDKMNARYIGERGFDLTPGALAALTGKKATKYWTGVVSVCKLKGE